MVIKTILHRASFTMLRAIENFKELVENIFCYKCYIFITNVLLLYVIFFKNEFRRHNLLCLVIYNNKLCLCIIFYKCFFYINKK